MQLRQNVDCSLLQGTFAIITKKSVILRSLPLLPQRIQNSIATQTAVLFHFLPPIQTLPVAGGPDNGTSVTEGWRGEEDGEEEGKEGDEEEG